MNFSSFAIAEVHGVLHGFAVANLPDENHVRSLTQRVLQGGAVGVGVDAHLPLNNHALLTVVHKLIEIGRASCRERV